MLLLVRSVTLTLAGCVLVTLYLSTLTLPKQKKIIVYNNRRNIKNIVAYSLKKQIEIDSEEVFCDQFSSAPEVSIQNGEEESGNNDGTKWHLIPETELYVYSVYLDSRLSPHKYLRIIGMVQGRCYLYYLFIFFIFIIIIYDYFYVIR